MTQLGQDIINMYKPYRNHHANWKTVTISKQKFEIPDRYEIIDVSKVFHYHHSRPRRLWYCSGCKGQIVQDRGEVTCSYKKN